MRVYRLFLFTLYAVSLGIVAQLLIDGWSYYLTPLAERPRHELYWELKPGGRRGHLYGVLGSGMMVLMLLYSVRKRFSFLRRLGPLRVWLDIHIYFGILGPILVVLHSSFKVQGLVAVSFYSMIAVAASGVLGRYLYMQILKSSGERITRAHRLFHYWHIFHKPFAIAMYLFMGIHIAVAWMAGYAWGIE